MIRAFATMAWSGARNAARHPARLALIVALLGLSLMFATAMAGLNAGARARLDAARGAIGTDIELRQAGAFGPVGGGRLSAATLRAAAEVPGVAAVIEQIVAPYDGSALRGAVAVPSGMVAAPGGRSDGTLPPLITGITPGDGEVTLLGGGTATIVAGRGLTADDAERPVALLGRRLAEVNGITVGARIDLRGTTVEVVGLYDSGQQFGNNSLVVPIGLFRRALGRDDADSAIARVRDGRDAAAVAARLREQLGDGVDVIDGNARLSATFGALEGIGRGTRAGLLLALGSAALIIVAAVVLIVRERTAEIGVLKALGASFWQIAAQFGAEILVIATAAALAAPILLVAFGGAIAGRFGPARSTAAAPGGPTVIQLGGPALPAGADGPLGADLTPQALALILAAGVGLAVLASVLAAIQAALIEPAEAIRRAG